MTMCHVGLLVALCNPTPVGARHLEVVRPVVDIDQHAHAHLAVGAAPDTQMPDTQMLHSSLPVARQAQDAVEHEHQDEHRAPTVRVGLAIDHDLVAKRPTVLVGLDLLAKSLGPKGEEDLVMKVSEGAHDVWVAPIPTVTSADQNTIIDIPNIFVRNYFFQTPDTNLFNNADKGASLTPSPPSPLLLCLFVWYVLTCMHHTSWAHGPCIIAHFFRTRGCVSITSTGPHPLYLCRRPRVPVSPCPLLTQSTSNSWYLSIP